MGSDFLGVRLNYKKHRDIIDWLNKFEDKSEESRRLLLLGIHVSRGEHRVPAESKPIAWNLPTVPTVKEKTEKSSLVMNILGSFRE